MVKILMPRLGYTMVTGTIEKWHKKEGDKVEKGDILFEVVTDKVTIEIESVYSGYLRKIIAEEGQEIPVREIIGYIGEKDEKVPEVAVNPLKRIDSADEEQKIGAGAKGKTKASNKKLFISPLARKTAKELEIDYKTVQIKGSGPEGRITKEDILAYAKMMKEDAQELEERAGGAIQIKSSSPIRGMRKVIAERMSYSNNHIPHLVLNARADVTLLLNEKDRVRDKISSEHGLKLTFTDFLLKACANSLRENIKINSSLQDGRYLIYEDINVGFAVSVKEGIIVPTIYTCDKLGLIDITRKRIELVDKAIKSKLSLDEVTNGTFTVSNLGMFGVRSFTAIINPPQAAILAVGEIYKDASIRNGEVVTSSFIDLSLSCDHRIIDGAVGANFLQKIVDLIENPKTQLIK
jgi:pyruvate dehydrogenase E2 component (dihydrolipoamide acetyltransferase)